MPPFVATMRTSPAFSESSATGTLLFEIVTPPSGASSFARSAGLLEQALAITAAATTIAFVTRCGMSVLLERMTEEKHAAGRRVLPAEERVHV
jgi:hypothetical protein